MKDYNETRRYPRVPTPVDEESKTQKNQADQADIGHIIKRFQMTGVPPMATVDRLFRDVSEFEDFADLMRQTKVAEAEFMSLPSKVREVFGHDVMNWLDAAHDREKFEAVRPRLEALGVVEPRGAPEPEPAPPPAGE